MRIIESQDDTDGDTLSGNVWETIGEGEDRKDKLGKEHLQAQLVMQES